MKKLLFLLFILFLFSCEKYKEPCWICTEMANRTIVRTWEVCDVLEASDRDGRRWITYSGTYVTVHTINCEQE
jgi:hypothetical protein